MTGSTTPTDPRADFAYFDHTSGVPALVSAGALLLAAAAGVLAVFRSPSPGGRYPRLLGVGLGIVVLVGGGVAGALSDRVDASIAESVSLDELRTAGGGAELWELANECASGERAACVELHATAPEGSPYRDYARTCGERHQPALRFCR